VQVVDNDCAVPIFAAFPRVFLMSTPQKAPHSISTIYRLKAGTVPIIDTFFGYGLHKMS